MVLDRSPPRILLTGKDGQVGHALQQALASFGHVTAVGRKECDLTRPDAIRALVSQVSPDIIVNPAAYTAVDKAETERDLAFAVNVSAPTVLAEVAAATGALLVHYSTDYVFRGEKVGAYSEEDAPNPQSVYGVTKLAGEEAIRLSGCRHFILRTSWVYGAYGVNFLKTVLRLAAERETVRIVADQFGAPTSAVLIAKVTGEMLRQHLGVNVQQCKSEPSQLGTYHLAASGYASWHTYAKFVVSTAEQLGITLKLSEHMIEGISTDEYPLPAKRPTNSQLETTKLRSAFNVILPHWQFGVTDALNELFKK